VPLAIQNFLQQTIQCELVILDDGQDSIADLTPADARVEIYPDDATPDCGRKTQSVRAGQPGQPHHALDDDDWVAPYRIRYQVEALLRERAEVCGLRQMLFHDLSTSKTWLYTYPPNLRAWLIGGSLLYTRKFLAEVAFSGRSGWRRRAILVEPEHWKVACFRTTVFYVAMIHPANTSPKYALIPIGPAGGRSTVHHGRVI